MPTSQSMVLRVVHVHIEARQNLQNFQMTWMEWKSTSDGGRRRFRITLNSCPHQRRPANFIRAVHRRALSQQHVHTVMVVLL